MMPRRTLIFLAIAALIGVAPAFAHAPKAKPDWAFQQSDLRPEPQYRFGRLANGMRYIVRRNVTPAGTAMVRMNIEAGSLDEGPQELGYAHFVEHMAFNGSTHVPEGEMIRLLERNGLSFGADTNAQTSFERTTYMLDLPRADTALLDTALMLMRETASELAFTPEAVGRERGVVLSELRDGQGYALANLRDQLAFLYPAATYPTRLPIGTVAALDAATAGGLRAFWAREYVPEKTTLVVVGDFDPEDIERAIHKHFDTWAAAPDIARPHEGRVDPKQKRDADVWIDPALSERITASRHGAWLDEPDTAANRRLNLLRQIGYGVVNRRFQRMSRKIDPPFRGAGFGTSAVFRIGRTTNLVVDTVDGGWARGLAAATGAWRQAMTRGFTKAEIDEQLANIRTGLENAAASAGTRSNAALVNAALALVRDDAVPTDPAGALARFNAFAPTITPGKVLAALRTEAVLLKDPLIRFQGRTSPSGGERALRTAWNAAWRARTGPPETGPIGAFAYTDFGAAGIVVSDSGDTALGIRTLRFANGVRLNLKPTTLDADRVQVRVSVDGGEMLDTRDHPLATEMMAMFTAGGLGKHSQDDLQTLLAGRSVGGGLGTAGDVFASGVTTTRRDLEPQLQYLAALLTDPGYRREGEVLYKQNIANFFARYLATPGAALGNTLGGLLSDNDPRFTLQRPEEYQRLSFAGLRDAVSDRLMHGAVEIALVGDFDEAQAIALVGKTFGALPAREAEFRSWDTERQRPFTAARGLRVIRHQGEKNQAIIRYVWPTRDDADPVEALTLELLQEVTGIEVLDVVREQLGKSYSPGAQSSPSRIWHGYGTFAIQASVDVADVAATRKALDTTLRGLIAAPVDADVLQRARAPMLERIDNALKTNSGWMALAERAQTRPERIDRYRKARARLEALTAADIQAAARRYLVIDRAVQVLVLPEDAEAPPA